MEYGVDFNVTLALNRNKVFTKNVPKKAALDTVMSGACWPLDRVSECYPEVSNICGRCHADVETDFHVLTANSKTSWST